MHPIDHYNTIRAGHEELIRKAEYERMVRKAMVKQGMNMNIHKAANWLGLRLVSWGEKLEQFGTFSDVQRSQTSPKRLQSM
jgi:hypothetical protein